MNGTRNWRTFAASAIALFACATAAGWASGGEQAEEFVRELSDRGLDELVLVYLDRMQTSQLANDGFRRRIPLHRGKTLVALSRRTPDAAAQAKLVADAREQLEKYAAANPNNVDGAEAQRELGNLFFGAGKASVKRADHLPAGAAFDAERDKLLREARRSLADARQLYHAAAGIYKTVLDTTAAQAAAAPDAAGSKRAEVRDRMANAQVQAAEALFDVAQSFPPTAKEYRESHESAAAEMAGLHELYGKSPTGVYARIIEGRCYQAVGAYPMALGCFKDVLDLEPVLGNHRELLATTYHYNAECLIAQQKLDAAIESCKTWLGKTQVGEERRPSWLAVRFQLAEALRQKSTGQPADSAEQRKSLAEAREAYRFVAASAGEYQAPARTAAADLKARGGAAVPEPKTFQEAFDLGRDALASSNAAEQALAIAEKSNPESVPNLKADIEDGRDEASRFFQQALSLADESTDRAALNEVRFFVGWLYWAEQDYYRAAVVSEFVARRYPEHVKAAAAARVAMAAYEQLDRRAGASPKPADSDFASHRMADLADFIVRRWPESPDAEVARAKLVSNAIRSGRIEDAQRLLDAAAPEVRPKLQLQLGVAMWQRYAQLASASDGKQPDAESLKPLRQAAAQQLRAGWEASRSGNEISPTSVAAGIYLAQALVADGEHQKAVEVLEDRAAGPLTLLARKDPTASRPEVVSLAYQTALRAYVSAKPPQIEKASDVLSRLEKAAAEGNGISTEQLTPLYVSFGRQLQSRIESERLAGRAQEADRFSSALAGVLDHLTSSLDNADWSMRHWTAQAFYTLGKEQRAAASAAGGNNSAVPAKGAARESLIKARDVYVKLLAAAAGGSVRPPNDTALLSARYQLGECYRELGQFKESLDTLSGVLAEKESYLSVQRAAALAYQQRGLAEGQQWLERAIHGGYQVKATGENRLWGWLKLSQAADRASRTNPEYRDLFFESRLEMARCRYLIATQSSGPDREQNLAQAKQSIQSVSRLYPELGGPARRAEFDSLVKQIDAAMSPPQTANRNLK